MFPGMEERLYKELVVIVPEGVEAKIIAPPELTYSVWMVDDWS